MDSNEALISHITDLARRSYSNNIYTFSQFLSMSELSEVHSAEKDLKYAGITFFGGMEGCERQMVRFGSEEMLGYEEAFPICTLVVKPRNSKFADDLTHRDFLGAIMNLGIDRDVIGDICVRGNTGYVFCDAKIADFLAESLTRIRHTSVSCTVSDECPDNARPLLKEEDLIVSSDRCDCLISGLFKLSRSSGQELFRTGNIFIDGRQCQSAGTALKEGNTVSVRGYGKFIYDGICGRTGKGRFHVRVRRYM